MKLHKVALSMGLCCTLALACLSGRADELSRELADQSYRVGEARRLGAMSRQLDLNYRMLWLNGYRSVYPSVFEPWPRVPGDIWSYPISTPIEHPIGQENVQIGANRWLSRPIYSDREPAVVEADVVDEEAAARSPEPSRPLNRPAPPPARVELPGPSDRDASEPVRRPRFKPKRAGGPREF